MLNNQGHLTQAVADRANRPKGQRRDLLNLVWVKAVFGANPPGRLANRWIGGVAARSNVPGSSAVGRAH
jgi:hypothetical protein